MIINLKKNKLQKRVVCNYEVRKTEEERMLDSGHYELAEAKKRAARIESMSVDSITNVQPKTPSLSAFIRPVHQSYRFDITKIKYENE